MRSRFHDFHCVTQSWIFFQIYTFNIKNHYIFLEGKKGLPPSMDIPLYYTRERIERFVSVPILCTINVEAG